MDAQHLENTKKHKQKPSTTPPSRPATVHFAALLIPPTLMQPSSATRDLVLPLLFPLLITPENFPIPLFFISITEYFHNKHSILVNINILHKHDFPWDGQGQKSFNHATTGEHACHFHIFAIKNMWWVYIMAMKL